MGSLVPLLLKHWKGLVLTTAAAAVGAYIAFLHNTITNDHIMLDAAHDQMTKMAAEYRSDVEAMTTKIKTQNEAIDNLDKAGKAAEVKVATAIRESNAVRRAANAQVNAILSRPVAVGCDNSIKEAITDVTDLSWESIK